MTSAYASALRKATLAAARLHRELGTQQATTNDGSRVDVFEAVLRLEVPLLFRPLDGLLGAYITNPTRGVLVTTKRPLSVQRFTAAHELGHERMGHQISLDDDSILRRSPYAAQTSYDLREVEADAFAVEFLMPRWLVAWHCERQGWTAASLKHPETMYQLSLRIGISYEAACWTMVHHKFLPLSAAQRLTAVEPRTIKASLLGNYQPNDFWGDVWILTEADKESRISGSRADLFVLRLPEHSGGGYLWSFDELQKTGFVIVADERETPDESSIGDHVIRKVTALSKDRQQGELHLTESRPWQTTQSLNTFLLSYDLTGPEQGGYSQAERRQLIEAA
jgi:Zn-dependent peptidase ImmA (M78 family)